MRLLICMLSFTGFCIVVKCAMPESSMLGYSVCCGNYNTVEDGDDNDGRASVLLAEEIFFILRISLLHFLEKDLYWKRNILYTVEFSPLKWFGLRT